MNTPTATNVADFCGFDMVFPIWMKKAERCKSLDQLTTHFWSCEALEKFLQHKTCSENLVCAFKSMPKCADLRR